MAKLKGRTASGKGLALKGKLLVTVNRGQLIASNWPKKRGKPKSAITREQNEWFRQANYLAKYADGDSQWMAIELAKGGPLYPRDILMSAMKGRLFERLIVDGEEWTAVAVRDDVSSDLDLLAGKDVGTILFRGSETWQALIAGATNQVLTSNGPDLAPSYQPPAGGGAGIFTETRALTSFSGSAKATKMSAFVASENFQISKIWGKVSGIATQTYIGRIIATDSSHKITEILASAPEVTIGTTGIQFIEAEFAAPVDLVAGTEYHVGFSRTDGNDTTINQYGAATINTGPVGLPMSPFAISSNNNVVSTLAKVTPAVDDTFVIGTNFLWYLGVLVVNE